MTTEEQNEANLAALRRDCQPDSALEEEAFERYAWATRQAKRFRQAETEAEERYSNDPGNPNLLFQLERILKMAIAQERRADRALKALRDLQKDRFAAYEVQAELHAMGRAVEIPKSLPVTELRKSNLQRTNPNYLAQFLLYQTQELKDFMAAPQTEPNEANPFAHMEMDELRDWLKARGL
ncbi:hypothetical protein [Bryobacter aggregatus]|uniref:hypothetical protein n=1 Tax=Bryobacter aggregatus TaxID=360054 RepID=UPI0004E20943|nr:hypothetical protein [Bryobacter aggregatus]